MEILYTYNKQKDIETEVYTNELNEAYSRKRYEYIYNSDGQWIKRLEYRNGKLYKINERQLECYE